MGRGESGETTPEQEVGQGAGGRRGGNWRWSKGRRSVKEDVVGWGAGWIRGRGLREVVLEDGWCGEGVETWMRE